MSNIINPFQFAYSKGRFEKLILSDLSEILFKISQVFICCHVCIPNTLNFSRIMISPPILNLGLQVISKKLLLLLMSFGASFFHSINTKFIFKSLWSII